MNLTFVFVFLLLLILLFIILLIITDNFEQKENTNLTSTEYNALYELPSPWYWITLNNIPADQVIFNNPQVVGVFNGETYTFQYSASGLISGIGPNGEELDSTYFGQNGKAQLVPYGQVSNSCTTYTFLSSDPTTPSSGKLTLIGGCDLLPLNENGVPGGCYQSTINVDKCYDDDQILAIEAEHVCAGQINYGTPTGDSCRGQSGRLYTVNEVENFFTNCRDSKGNIENKRCDGSLSFLVFGEIGDNSVCMSGASFDINGTGHISNISPVPFTAECSLTNIYKGFPNDLYRVTPYTYEGKFKFDNNGKYLKIYSRSSGLCLSPQFLINESNQLITSSPITGPVQLIPCSTLTAPPTNGSWWYNLPALIAPPPYEIVNGKEVILGTRPQLIYVTNPNELPRTLDLLWQYVFTNRAKILSVQRAVGIATCLPIIITDINQERNSQLGSINNQFSVVNYIFANYLI